MSNLSIDEAGAQATLSQSQSMVFADGGEMCGLMRTLDWSQTALGSPNTWSPALRMMASFLLANRFPQLLWWGPQFYSLYNDAYIPILGEKHPWALGRPLSEVWKEIWHVLKPLVETPYHGGPATWMEDIPLEIKRRGFLEETHFTVAYSPVPDETAPSGIGGVLATVHEITDKVIGERRVQALRELGAHSAEPKSAEEACAFVGKALLPFSKDVPFFLLYLLDEQGKMAARTCCIGADPDDKACPISIELMAKENEIWPLSAVYAQQEIRLVGELTIRFDVVPKGPWSDGPSTAAVVPIRSNMRHKLAGFMVAGLSSRLHFDDRYADFLELMSTQIATMIANARAYEHERKRVEELAELDRAKTLFFSNISHELRTPLTLLLGPTESALASEDRVLKGADLEMLHRNELRLLKLVNTLLDFSRVEAGRAQAVYAAFDLAALTAEIASVFRSAIERAGLRFTVNCESIDEPVYVDRDMWEKIVLNLLSNAFKFTFEGSIAVALRRAGECVELEVRDTGTGIPESEMPRIFERFHRVEAAQARTHEGTGIGLAMVQELARLHGGSVRVESETGKGSTFTVSIPLGAAHIAEEQIGDRRTSREALMRDNFYVEEEQHSIQETAERAHASPTTNGENAASKRETILVADDNADMRRYLVHLLSPAYDVHAVSDGIAAVDAAVRLRPALVLSDIMMSGRDGFGVLRAIREHSELSGIPVILLSARAGEESTVEGLDAGADDYLVKPFTARELLARVGTHIRMAEVRREAAELEARLRSQAECERERFKEMLRNVPAAIGLLHGPEHRWIYVNNRYVKVTGRSNAEEFIGKTIRESLPELEGQPFFDLLDNVYETGESCEGREIKAQLLRVGTLEDVYFDFVYQPILNAEGKADGILVHAIDVTDRVLARKVTDEVHERLLAAHMTAQLLAGIVLSSDDAIVSKDLEGIVTSWNPGAEKMFGYTAEEIIGTSIVRLHPPEMVDDEKLILATISRGERIQHFETVRMTKDGERIDVSLTISPVRDESGRIVGASKIARDITQRKRAERALHTTERLASVGRLAATIAHEINNPLEAVTNLVYLAKSNTDDPVVRPYLDQAEEELSRVSLLTRQTLGFYRETKGTRTLTLGSMISPLVFAMQPRARNKSVSIGTNFRQDPEIQAIPGEIRQLIANLIGNSIDAAANGSSIQVRVSETSFIRGERKAGVRLTISDQGEGIPLSARARVFEPFFTTKKEVGTGLGLWVCWNIVEKHGGSIRYRSSTRAERSGTVFCVFLPCEAPASVNEADGQQVLNRARGAA